MKKQRKSHVCDVFFAKAEKSSLVLCFIELKGTKHNSVKKYSESD